MKDMIYARWLLLKRHIFKIIFWLILPLLLTVVITMLVNRTSDDFQVPLAVVTDEDSTEMNSIIQGLDDSEFINIETFEAVDRSNVLRQLEQYQFDSVFIFPEDFEERLRQGERRNLIKTYYTDQSLYYEPSKELVASLVQEKIGEYTTIDDILQLQDFLLSETEVETEEILAERERIETETNLVNQIFYFQGEQQDSADENRLDPWVLWAYITFLSTIFMFDFVTRETINSASNRFYFMRYSYTLFMLLTLLIFTVAMLLIDIATYLVMREILEADISIFSLTAYRIVINTIAFLVAYFAKSQMKLYQTAIALTIITLALHLVMPVIISFTGLNVVSMLHPAVMFTQNKFNIPWLIILTILILICIRRDKLVGS